MKIYRDTEGKIWRDLVNEDPFATFFQTPDWYLVAENYGAIDYHFCYMLQIDQQVYAFPVGIKKYTKGWVKKHICSPFGTFGGVIAESKVIPWEHKTEIYRWLSGIPAISYRDNPYRPLLQPGDGLMDHTQVLMLDELNPENIFKGWTKGHKSAAKKAIREGVYIELARSEQDWKDYYTIYLDSIRRWEDKASSFYEFSLFQNIRALEKAKLWLAKFKGKNIAGCLCFYHNKHLVYWHGAALEAFFHLKPVHGLQAYIILHALQNGFLYYDFNPSGGHQGVIKFKKGFNANFIPHQILEKDALLTRIAKQI